MAAEPPSSESRPLVGLMVMGSEMAGFTILGLLLDFALGTIPWLTVAFTVFGFGVVFFHLMRMAKALSGKKP
jgi:F0F1-type ATP synthase assembly protein I